MPATSGKQYRFMEGIAHGGIVPRGSLTPAKAEEFVHATPANKRKAWAKKKKSKARRMAEAMR